MSDYIMRCVIPRPAKGGQWSHLTEMTKGSKQKKAETAALLQIAEFCIP